MYIQTMPKKNVGIYYLQYNMFNYPFKLINEKKKN